MAFIYKITNNLNNKSYIGKTLLTIEKRWKQHLRDSKKDSFKNRPLYTAINKYTSNNFVIELLEEVSEIVVNDREIYWIEYYDTYKSGYNATKGGDGKSYINRQEVIDCYLKVQSAKEVSRLLSIHEQSVRNILKENKITLKTKGDVSKAYFSKRVAKIDKTSGAVIQIYPSIKDAFKDTENSSFSHISAVCNKTRKTAYGFKWEFI